MVQTMEIKYKANQNSGEGGASPAPAKEMSQVKAKKFEISKATQEGEEVVGEVVVVAEPRGELVSRHFSRRRKRGEVSLNSLWLTSLAAVPREYRYRPKEGGKTRPERYRVRPLPSFQNAELWFLVLWALAALLVRIP